MKKVGTIAILFLIFRVFLARAQPLYQERIYEPVVLRGMVLSGIFGVPIDQIYVYAYHADSRSWTMIPFQIDERVLLQDIYEAEHTRHYYFFPDTNTAFDIDDELVFLVRDLGDRAPPRAWIEDKEARTFNRVELKIYDPRDPLKAAYAYVFRSSTISQEVPAPYDFWYDPNRDSVATKYYSLRLNQNSGLINDIVIKPPFGNGKDIFDTQKFRFIGLLSLGFFTFTVGKGGKEAANEDDNLYRYQPSDGDKYYLKYTKKPIVRLIREVRQTIRFGTAILDELGFYVNTSFYPFGGMARGGAALDSESLKSDFPGADDPYVELELLRQSWDFNANATGMRFYNKHNGGLLIDGIPDNPDKTIDQPIQEWTLVTGNQGSMFTYTAFKDTLWNQVELYYYDNKNGGQGDGTLIAGGDTGDSLSYGDNGILFRNADPDSASLELGFEAYFLPGNLTREDAENLADIAQLPVRASSNIQTGIELNTPTHSAPRQYALGQNFPNPFTVLEGESLTRISFTLLRKTQVKIVLYDLVGRNIRVLCDGEYLPGTHTVHWDGTDGRGREMPGGIYYYRLITPEQKVTRRMVLLR